MRLTYGRVNHGEPFLMTSSPAGDAGRGLASQDDCLTARTVARSAASRQPPLPRQPLANLRAHPPGSVAPSSGPLARPPVIAAPPLARPPSSRQNRVGPLRVTFPCQNGQKSDSQGANTRSAVWGRGIRNMGGRFGCGSWTSGLIREQGGRGPAGPRTSRR